MVLVIDNYDSFTYNLVQLLRSSADLQVRDGGPGGPHHSVQVFRNDAIDVGGIRALAPSAIVISPGPGRPEDSGCTLDVIREFARDTPILGVCLGLQALGQAFGAQVVPAAKLMHGKTSPVYHYGEGLFRGLSCPFTAMRYHSLVVDPASLPPELELTAYTSGGEVMGLALRGGKAHAVQFHPESILTVHGAQIIANFLQLSGIAGGAA